MRLPLVLLLLILNSLALPAQPRLVPPDYELSTPFERDTLSSASYGEAVAYYQVLAKAYPNQCRVDTLGLSDAGVPLYLVVLGAGASSATLPTSRTFFVNNGIHAGEPCGVDASMLFARDLLEGNLSVNLTQTTVALIPAYNVDGMLNRGQPTRVNQVGPRQHGFRGNARHYDLNRDFMKRDTRNARMLTECLRNISPDVFIDTHTTNGADYQYELTVIATQPEKLGPVLGPFLQDRMLPELYQGMERRGHPVSPYVYSPGVPQEKGLFAFIESPRYSSGYAALQHSLSFITESHMLKPFATRVRATQSFLETALAFYVEHQDTITALRSANRDALFAQDSVTLAWTIDRSRTDTVAFRGYQALREPSRLTGGDRLRYDREQPQTFPTPYHRYAAPAVTVARPKAYAVPFAYGELLRRIVGEGSQVRIDTLRADTVVRVRQSYITSYQTVAEPYEGHYLHYAVETQDTVVLTTLPPLTYHVTLTPANFRELTAALEPRAPDSYFAWGFFDSWLQQKEHFSAYVFEETAERLLAANPTLRAQFSRKRDTDASFRENRQAQLNWLYERSPHKERGHLRYPVLRVF